jgi:hypothetical protein
MAMTSVLVAIDRGARSCAMRLPWPSCSSSCSHIDDVGNHTSGSAVPAAISFFIVPELRGVRATLAQRPSTTRPTEL